MHFKIEGFFYHSIGAFVYVDAVGLYSLMLVGEAPLSCEPEPPKSYRFSHMRENVTTAGHPDMGFTWPGRHSTTG